MDVWAGIARPNTHILPPTAYVLILIFFTQLVHFFSWTRRVCSLLKAGMSMINKIRVVILDDHQLILDGYLSRFAQMPDIEVVGTATFAEELEPLLGHTKPDVLILDVSVPTSPSNPTPYPILHSIPKWLNINPQLTVLIISMLNQQRLVRAAIEVGAGGYILKDDQQAMIELDGIIRSVSKGGLFLSQKVREHLIKQNAEDASLTPRQLEVLSLCAAYPDASTSELADKLGVAPSTLRNLLSETYLRLGVHNRMAAVTKAIQLGLLAPLIPSADL